MTNSPSDDAPSKSAALTQVGCTRQVRRAPHGLADWLALSSRLERPEIKGKLAFRVSQGTRTCIVPDPPRVCVCTRITKEHSRALSFQFASIRPRAAPQVWCWSGFSPGVRHLIPGTPGNICGQEAGLAGWAGRVPWMSVSLSSVAGRTVGFTALPPQEARPPRHHAGDITCLRPTQLPPSLLPPPRQPPSALASMRGRCRLSSSS